MNNLLSILLLLTSISFLLAADRFLWFIYIHSGCHEQDNKTQFSKQSIALKENIISKWKASEFLKTFTFDVCFDHRLLTLTFTKMLLNSKFRNVVITQATGYFEGKTNIVSVAAYIPTRMFKLLQELMACTDIPIVAQSEAININSFHPFNNKIVHFREILWDIEHYISEFEWQEVILVRLEIPLQITEEFDVFLYNTMLQVLKKRKHQCVKALQTNFFYIEEVDTWNMNHLFQLLDRNVEKQSVIIVASEEAMNYFIQKINENRYKINNILFLHLGEAPSVLWSVPLPENSTFLVVPNTIRVDILYTMIELHRKGLNFNEAGGLTHHIKEAYLFSLLYKFRITERHYMFKALTNDIPLVVRRYQSLRETC